MKTIFEAIIGSFAYGTNHKGSDTDFRGVGIELDLAYYFGFKKINQIQDKIKDKVIYDIRKFLSLAKDGNPNILEILYIDNKDLILHKDPIWESHIIPNRHLFLTKKVKHAYKGFALAQKKRIDHHRSWFTNPPIKPEPKDFFYSIAKHELYKNIAMEFKGEDEKNRIINYIDNMNNLKNLILIKCYNNDKLELFFRHKVTQEQGKLFDKNNYQKAVKEYAKYIDWRKNRNEKRAILENQYGYDTKHGYHTIRLIDQAEDILLLKRLRVSRPDRVDLWNNIRQGKVSYDDFHIMVEEGLKNLEKWTLESDLPNKPDYNKIENLCIDIIQKVIKR